MMWTINSAEASRIRLAWIASATTGSTNVLGEKLRLDWDQINAPNALTALVLIPIRRPDCQEGV
jgi:hypothetical protein